MKKFMYAVMLLLGLSMMASCGQDKTKHNEKNTRKCESCGKTYTSDDKYYDSEKGYSISCSLNNCAKCSARISKENDQKALREGIKKARNKWVDDNPNEARRRGIKKF